jgi:hypothetical protein
MKKILLFFSLFALTACEPLRRIADSSENPLVGVWDFPESRLLLIITETRWYKFGSEDFTELQTTGNRIVGIRGDRTEPLDYKILNRHSFWFMSGGQKFVGRRIVLDPATNQTLERGRYMLSSGGEGIDILDEVHAHLFSTNEQEDFKYLIHNDNIYFANDGYYFLCEIVDDTTFRGVAPEKLKGMIYTLE